ncbi:MAG: NH(3)-dependent NAD+ synthetase NadE [uncultured marine phage]|uniref:NH(3)-dependent NAD+ synthetase NadE n=1 Tax=uncultured marine phage TaxID=707152 RepID=A0A8D9CFL7_9VIRU|nr:MAG: NH(3)-dependent NAD+ synthetase NadE [uncultured marine phage]
MNYTGVADHITRWLKEYVESNPIKGFVIGVSGGIDSAVASTLCARTGLPLLVVEMPIHQMEDQVTTAKKHITFLKTNFDNVRSVEVNLTSTFDYFKNSLSETSDFDGTDENKEGLSLANLRSRLRMTTLYSLATMNDFIVCGTGNKVEDFGVFFYTKYGDGGVDVSPIADLMKSEVYALGAELGLIEEVLNAVPTDGLWEGSPTDEDQIGASYDELEWAMNFLESGEERNMSEREKEVMEIYQSRHKSGLHKSEEIPVCEIPNELR